MWWCSLRRNSQSGSAIQKHRRDEYMNASTINPEYALFRDDARLTDTTCLQCWSSLTHLVIYEDYSRSAGAGLNTHLCIMMGFLLGSNSRNSLIFFFFSFSYMISTVFNSLDRPIIAATHCVWSKHMPPAFLLQPNSHSLRKTAAM